MPWFSRAILKKDRAADVVLEFTPTQFNLGTPIQALEYMESRKNGSDFLMNPVIREQTGVEEIQKEDIASQAEELAIQRLAEIQEAAYQEGYALGLDEGLKKAYNEQSSQLHSRLSDFDTLVTSLGQLKSDLGSHNESHIVQLVFHMASRIAMRQIEMDTTVVVDVMKQALTLAQDEENIRVQVSDKQIEFLEDVKKNSHSREFEFLKKVKLESNPEIKPGGCIVETNYGEVDSRIEQRLEKLWDHLKEAIPHVKLKVSAEGKMINDSKINLQKYHNIVSNIHLSKDSGKVKEVIGMTIKGYLPGASVGSIVEIFPSGLDKSFLAEIVGFKDKDVLMMALGEMRGVALGSKIILSKQIATVKISDQLLGRIVNGLGEPIDGHEAIEDFEERSLYSEVVNPLDREPIRAPLDLGVRAINSCLTVGLGQRVAIMAGSGVGKSVLLGMMAKNTNADVNVIALIGERGREVREFIEGDLGPEGMKKSIIVCVTSDQSPLLRMRGAYVATAIAEHFSQKGKNVLLMMDSITRFAMAQREIGLSTGEPPSSRGYTPSVFAQLPKLLERAGNFENSGSITGLYTTLVEGDDMNDPIGDSVRSIVDGHIVLSRSLAQKGHFPSIDVLQSASRVFKNVTKPEHQKLAQKVRENLAVYKEAEDLINIGAYKPGANPKIDRAIKVIDQINDFLKQGVNDPGTFSQTQKHLQTIFVGQ